MKITPLEIRQKTFEKVFRGFDKDEVSAFLLSLSQEWERIMDEKKELAIKLEASEKEVGKLREVETSLFKTLKTAEDTGANMIEQANKASQLHLKETEMKAESIMQSTKLKAKDIVDSAESKAKEVMSRTMEELKVLQQSYDQLQNLKQNLITEIRNFNQDSLSKLNNFASKKEKYNIEELIREAEDFAGTLNASNESERIKRTIDEEKMPKKRSASKVNHNKKEEDSESSFFDTIE